MEQKGAVVKSFDLRQTFLSFDMCFVGVLGCRSFIGWLCGEMVGIGGVGVADAGVIGSFIEILAISGFEFGLGGFFFCGAKF